MQEIHEGEEGGGDVGIHADPDYVPEEGEEGEVLTDDDNAPGLANNPQLLVLFFAFRIGHSGPKLHAVLPDCKNIQAEI